MSNSDQQESIKKFMAEVDPAIDGAKPAAASLPATLPVAPTGYSKHMRMHMNFGSDGGAAKYSIKDPDGNDTPIGYQYDTRKGGITGFSLEGIEQIFKRWADLVAFWPEFVKAREA